MAEKMCLKVFFGVLEAKLMILSVQRKNFFNRIFWFFRVCTSRVLMLVRHYCLARDRGGWAAYLALFGLFSVFEQFVFDAVDKRLPACIDDVFRDAYRAPHGVGIS